MTLMMRTLTAVSLAVAVVSGCSSTAATRPTSSGVLSGLVSAAAAAPSCASLVGKPLPQIAKADGCIFVAADGSKNLRPPVSYLCTSGGDLYTFPGIDGEAAYWAVPGMDVVSGALSAAERAGSGC